MDVASPAVVDLQKTQDGFRIAQAQGFGAFSRIGGAGCLLPRMLLLVGAAARVFVFPLWPLSHSINMGV